MKLDTEGYFLFIRKNSGCWPVQLKDVNQTLYLYILHTWWRSSLTQKKGVMILNVVFSHVTCVTKQTSYNKSCNNILHTVHRNDCLVCGLDCIIMRRPQGTLHIWCVRCSGFPSLQQCTEHTCSTRNSSCVTSTVCWHRSGGCMAPRSLRDGIKNVN